jgi:hypothetical protein
MFVSGNPNGALQAQSASAPDRCSNDRGKLLRSCNDAVRKRLIEAGLATNERPCCLRKELIKVDEKDLTLRALSSKVKALEAP